MGTALQIAADAVATRAVVLVCTVLVVPIRLWSLVVHPPLLVYRLFPSWLQAVVIVVFLAQALAALRRSALRPWTAAAFCVSLGTAAVQGVADFRTGAWLWWGIMAGVQAYTYWRVLVTGGRA